jgi:hypothetical protein
MIYHSYNFVDSYSNASGNRQDKIVLGELGKVINKEPKAVITALKNAGIQVPKRATRKDLVRLIIANKRNKTLIQSLSVLITASATYSKSAFANFGEGDTSEEGLTKLPTLSASQGLKGQAKGTTELQKGEDTGKGFLQGIANFFQSRKASKAENGTKSTSEDQNNWKKFQNWFNKNRGTINQVGTTLYNSLGTANTGSVPLGGDGGSGSGAGSGADQTWIQRNKTLVVVGIIAIGGLVYFATKGKGKGKGK